MCVCTVWVSYSISSTGLSAPIGHQACVSYTLKQWRTPRILIQEVLASVLCVYVCVCLRTSVCMCSQQSGGGSGAAVWWSVVWRRVLRLEYVCIWVWQCALWGHYESVCLSVLLCVCVRPSVRVFHGHSLRLINIDSELSLLAGSQVGSMEQIWHTSKEKHIYVRAHMHVQIQPVS